MDIDFILNQKPEAKRLPKSSTKKKPTWTAVYGVGFQARTHTQVRWHARDEDTGLFVSRKTYLRPGQAVTWEDSTAFLTSAKGIVFKATTVNVVSEGDTGTYSDVLANLFLTLGDAATFDDLGAGHE